MYICRISDNYGNLTGEMTNFSIVIVLSYYVFHEFLNFIKIRICVYAQKQNVKLQKLSKIEEYIVFSHDRVAFCTSNRLNYIYSLLESLMPCTSGGESLNLLSD